MVTTIYHGEWWPVMAALEWCWPMSQVSQVVALISGRSSGHDIVTRALLSLSPMSPVLWPQATKNMLNSSFHKTPPNNKESSYSDFQVRDTWRITNYSLCLQSSIYCESIAVIAWDASIHLINSLHSKFSCFCSFWWRATEKTLDSSELGTKRA